MKVITLPVLFLAGDCCAIITRHIRIPDCVSTFMTMFMITQRYVVHALLTVLVHDFVSRLKVLNDVPD